jgi:hypothetical protein
VVEMTELHIKGEVLKVSNMYIDGLPITQERDQAVVRLIKEALGNTIRITKIEENKGKRTRQLLVIESQ